MTEVFRQKNIQETQYSFPYHYIPLWDGDEYCFARTMNWGYLYLSYLYFIVNKVSKHNFDSLLDVGCGDGRFLYEVSQKIHGKRFIGIDYFQPAIDFARIMNPEVKWICGDIEDHDLLDPVDIITMLDVLEHVQLDKVQQFLKGVYQYLKEDGILIVTVPSKNTPIQKKHYQHFDEVSLKKALCPYFEIEEVHYLNRRPSKFQKKIIRLMSNRFYIINYSKLLGWLYKYYEKHLLLADKDKCWRIAVTCGKR